MPTRFSAARLRAIGATKYLRLRAGPDHRFVAVWVVVVDGRVLVRSWNDKPDGWFRAFLAEREGAILVDGEEVRVRAAKPRGAKVLDAMESAYASKYDTKANEKYVRGFSTPRRRAASLELRPA